jgi:hypothetical protein
MANGTPIRLVQRNGGIIELNVTTLSLDVDRKFNARPKVYSGSHRIATDSNLSRAVITLEGIITDDDAVFQTTETKASASIDFSYFLESRRSGGRKMTDEDKRSMVTFGGFITPTNKFGDAQRLFLSSTQEIRFVSHATLSSGTQDGVPWVQIHDQTNAISAGNIALFVKQAIEANYSSDFTAVRGTSPYTGEANAMLTITRTASGNDRKFPKYKGVGLSSPSFHIVTKFINAVEGGGQSGNSAGDKVQRLWGVLNNSQDGGRGRFRRENDDGVGKLRGGGDYIIGVQVPFDSMINASDGERYSARNFFMTTGSYYLQNPDRKDVENAVAAGARFEDTKNSYTGIKGGIDKATFVRLGGEPIYQFTIIFLPADVIL